MRAVGPSPVFTPEPHTPLFRSIFSLRPVSRTKPAPPPEAAPEPPLAPEPPKPHRRWRWALGAAAALGVLGAVSGLLVHEHRTTQHSVLIVNGVPSFRKSNGHAERWQQSHLKIYIDDSVNQLGPAARTAVENAFGAWLATDADLPSLTFDTTHGSQPGETQDGRNTVMVAPINIPGHQNDLAISIGFSDEDTGTIVETDIVINSRHRFGILGNNSARLGSTPSANDAQDQDHVGGDGGGSCTTYNASAASCGDRYDLQDVMTHEVGHFFGMADDLTDNMATMYKCTSVCETHKREVDAADGQAVTRLYAGGFADGASAASCTVAASPGGSSPAENAALALALAVGAAALTRRRRNA